MSKRAADDPIRAALARDDPAAVEMIWDRYAGDLLEYLQTILCSRHDAEDVLQAVFVKIVKQRRWLAQARHLNAYVYRITRNEAADYLGTRKRQGRPQSEARWWLEAIGSEKDDDGITEELQAALERLPAEQREVVVLKVYRSKTYEQVAELLDITRNTAASRYHYGMQKLRNMLKERLL